MKVYPHYRPRSQYLELALFTGIGLIILAECVFISTLRPGPGAAAYLILLVYIPLGINFWHIGRTAREIRLEDDGQIEFVSPLGTTRVAVQDLLSIAPTHFARGMRYIARHRNGAVRFDPRLNGMHELITELVRLNPAIELRGI